MKRLTGFLVWGVLSASLLGCSRQGATDNPSEVNSGKPLTSPAGLAAQLPPLPGRDASVLMQFVQQGYLAGARGGGAIDEGTSLRMASAPGGISWGVWGFMYSANPVQCLVDFSGEGGAEAYFAVSDYDNGVWEIGGPLPGPQQAFDIGDPKYANSLGYVYVAVIAFGGANILVDQLSIIADINPVRLPIDNSGGYTSMTLVGENPAISFYDDVDHNLCYVRATDPFGSNWAPVQTLDSAGDTGQWTSLKVVDGFPAVAYHDFTAKRLRYIRAIDVAGASWGLPMTVDISGECGEYASLDVVSGLPAISYHHADSSELRYVIAQESTGAAWEMPVSPDSDGNTGQETCLEVVDGFPAIAYRYGAVGEVRYVRSSDANGTAWGTPKILRTGYNSGYTNSLVVVNGRPAVACYDSSESALLYFRALDSVGDSWTGPQLLDGADDDAGTYCSMAVIGGVPCISYHHGLQGELRYVQASDANGSAWSSPLILDDSSVIVGKYTSLIDLYGVPAISHWDQTNGTLRYAWGL
jgi:hypothetical protein